MLIYNKSARGRSDKDIMSLISRYTHTYKIVNEVLLFSSSVEKKKFFKELITEVNINGTKYIKNLVNEYCLKLEIIDADIIVDINNYLTELLIESINKDKIIGSSYS